ncbi:MAG: FAD-binding oxidoreductase [Cyanobacteria bacterium]|nr:FAD-binding oxidoreductase [Cyanobacteriota bacterium]
MLELHKPHNRVDSAVTDGFICDAHSMLNRSAPSRFVRTKTIDDIQKTVRAAQKEGCSIAVAGGRHSMGGQQLVDDEIQIDITEMKQVLHLDRVRRLVKVEAGITWTELIRHLSNSQKGMKETLSIRQKPTGVDDITIGGCVSSNIHGRGLKMQPFIQDIEEIELVDAKAELVILSRTRNAELFRLVVGGYGLFGIIATVTLRLTPRRIMRRQVREVTARELMPALEECIADGHEYGDFQFSIDPASDDFLQKGILSTYKALGDETAPCATRSLSLTNWENLCELAHTCKSEAYTRYRNHYLSTDGQTYWSDLMQLSTYLEGYHQKLDDKLGTDKSSEMITEVYVSRSDLHVFLKDAASLLRELKADIVYGTIRLIEEDSDSFLSWARKSYACIVLNLHTEHTDFGIRKSRQIMRHLIDLAIAYDGSYYLTYHRWARRDQVERCYPQFREFLEQKLFHDPQEVFRSQWYDYHMDLLAPRRFRFLTA